MDIMHRSFSLSKSRASKDYLCDMKYCDKQSPPKETECTLKKKNNEECYISLIEGLETTREYGSNGFVVFTNSELVCHHMKCMYQVKKERLKQLHGEEKNIVNQF